jgi:hypothetical protein
MASTNDDSGVVARRRCYRLTASIEPFDSGADVKITKCTDDLATIVGAADSSKTAVVPLAWLKEHSYKP